jgi:hypothetical protein
VDFLPLAEFAYNNARQALIRTTPFRVVYGMDPRVIALDPLEKGEEGREAHDHVTYLTEIHEQAQKGIMKA